MKWLGALIIFLFPMTAHGEDPGVRNLLKDYDAGNANVRQYLEQRIADVQDGMSWANALLVHDHRTPIYCPPGKMVLTGSQLLDMLRRELADHPYEADVSIGAVMITALEHVFPCEKNPE